MARRPECFEFAMSFLGDPEQSQIREYVCKLERARMDFALLMLKLTNAAQPRIDHLKREQLEKLRAEVVPLLCKHLTPADAEVLVQQVITERISNAETLIDEYLDGYTMEGDAGSYTPTQRELFIVKDAIMGLLADPDFIAAIR